MWWHLVMNHHPSRRLPGGDQYQFQNSTDLKLFDVWHIPLEARAASALGHACPFPLELARQVLKAWSSPGDLVCDPYSGARTTALAAQELNRRFEGAEILEKYVVLARERLAQSASPRN